MKITLYGPRFLTLQVKIASLPMATDWFGIIPTNSGFCVRKLPENRGRRCTRINVTILRENLTHPTIQI